MQKRISGTKVCWGMIGTGDVTEIKSGPAFSKINHSQLIGVTNRTLAKAQDYAKRHQVKVYNDVAALLADPEINAVYIATPPDAHLPLARQVAEAGKPCYLEKPMARTEAECAAILELFSSRNLPLYVAYYRRSLPNFLKVRSLLEQKAIGDVRAVKINLVQASDADLVIQTEKNWRVNPTTSGGGYFYDLASHQFDLLEFLLGPIASLSGYKLNQAGHYAAADMVSASWHFASGVIGSGCWSFNAGESSKNEEITILGSQGKIRFPCFGAGIVHIDHESSTETFSFDLPKHIQQPLIESIVSDLLGKSVCPSTGATAMRANHWLEQVQMI